MILPVRTFSSIIKQYQKLTSFILPHLAVKSQYNAHQRKNLNTLSPTVSIIGGKSNIPIHPTYHKNLLLTKQKHTSIPQELFMQPETKITTLHNGLRVASQWTPHETITVGVFVDSGSRFETSETNGVAHFLEHLIFKGTKRRTRIQLEKEIENIGGHLNAYTAREQTVYYAKTFKKDLAHAMDILSDILIYSSLSPVSIEEERYVILREMEEVGKSLEEVIFDRLHMLVYQMSSLGYTILGPPENIMSMKRSWLVDYITKNYTANRIVVAAAGDVNHDIFHKLAEEYFHHVRPANNSRLSMTGDTLRLPEFRSGISLQKDITLPLTYCAIAYKGVHWDDSLQPVFMVLQQLLGSFDRSPSGTFSPRSSSNPFNQNLKALGVEAFSAFNTCYKDTGLFGAYFTLPGEGAQEVVKLFQSEIELLASQVSLQELETAKRWLKTSLFGSLDTTTSICEDIGRQLLVYGRRIPFPELYSRIESITPDTVREVVANRLSGQPFGIAAIGSVDKLKDLNRTDR